MQAKKIVQSIFFVIPVLAISACSSTSSTSAGASNTEGQEQTNQQSNTNNQSSNVQAGTVSRVKTPKELRQEKFANLRQSHTLYFDFDKSTLKAEFHELLEAHADFLVKHPQQRVLLEGHADEKGTPEYNIALGERRAKSVATFLKNLGVTSSQIQLVSYGEEKPLDKSRTERAFAKNRRAVLVYR